MTAATLVEAKKQGAVFAYGSFLTVVINFIIIAFALFAAVKGINRLQKPEPPAPTGPSKEVLLLTEIRDVLKTR